MISVLLADDHAIVRHGLRRLLEDETEIASVLEASNGAEALKIAQSENIDVVVLDISMPDKGGLDVLRDLRSFRPKLPVLILSMYPEDQYAVRMIRAGAAGYITKEKAAEELIRAIKTVAYGKRFITPLVAENLAQNLDDSSDHLPHEHLSDREYQVMRMIANGNTPTAIAEKLCLSIKTVSTYRTRILQKMGLRSSAEITHYAVKNHLVD